MDKYINKEVCLNYESESLNLFVVGFLEYKDDNYRIVTGNCKIVFKRGRVYDETGIDGKPIISIEN